MHISRKAFGDALIDSGPGGAGVIDMIDDALAKGEPVIGDEPDGSESLVEPGDQGGYKTTPIAKS